MMLEICVGDAYGSVFENTPKSVVRKYNNLSGYGAVTGNKRQVGKYTDDGQLSIAVALAMMDDEEPWTKETLAEFFLQVFKRDQRRGYTTYFLNVLLNSQSGYELLTKIDGHSTKSGGVMRWTAWIVR